MNNETEIIVDADKNLSWPKNFPKEDKNPELQNILRNWEHAK